MINKQYDTFVNIIFYFGKFVMLLDKFYLF